MTPRRPFPVRLLALFGVLGATAYLAFVADPSGPATVARPTERPPRAAVPPPAPAPGVAARSTAATPAHDHAQPGTEAQPVALRPRRQLMDDGGRSPGGGVPAPFPPASDPFGRRDWTPPPPPLPPVVAQAPTAPPLPFTYAGKRQDGPQWEVYLMRGDTVHIVREGSSFDGAYGVVSIKPPVLTLKYQPLGIEQTLPIGEAE